MAVLVEVSTVDGVTGFGEAMARGAPEMVRAVVDSLLTPLVVGRNWHAVEAIHDAMLQRMRLMGHSSGLVVEAISGVDTAIWDALGRTSGLPLWALLHGVGRRTVPCYASSVFIKSEAEMCEEASGLADDGYRLIKIKVGRSDDQGGVPADIDAVRAIRAAVADEVELCIDANSGYTAARALRVAAALEPIDLAFFEEPVPPDDLGAYLQVRNGCCIPLAGGENAFSIWSFRELLAGRLVSVVQPDLARCGGITGAVQVAKIAYAFDIPVAPHTGFSSGVSHLAALQVAAAIPNVYKLEHMCIDHPLRELFTSPFPQPSGGVLEVPDGPGLGLDIDPDRLGALGLVS